jgi:hypothetical protein
VFSFLEKDRLPLSFTADCGSQRDRDIFTHCVAFASCAMIIDGIIVERWPNEVAQIVAENNDQSRSWIGKVHSMFRSADKLKEVGIQSDRLPLKRVKHNVHWCDKQEPALQVADVCCFLIKCRVQHRPFVSEFFEELRPQLIMPPTGDPFQPSLPAYLCAFWPRSSTAKRCMVGVKGCVVGIRVIVEQYQLRTSPWTTL